MFIYYPAPYKDSQLVCNNDLATEALRKRNIPFIRVFKYLDEESRKEGSPVATLMEYDSYNYPELRTAIVPLSVTKKGNGYVRSNSTERQIKMNEQFLYIDVIKKNAQRYQETSIAWVKNFIKDKPEAQCRIND